MKRTYAARTGISLGLVGLLMALVLLVGNTSRTRPGHQ
jgi:hypothetical protein